MGLWSVWRVSLPLRQRLARVGARTTARVTVHMIGRGWVGAAARVSFHLGCVWIRRKSRARTPLTTRQMSSGFACLAAKRANMCANMRANASPASVRTSLRASLCAGTSLRRQRVVWSYKAVTAAALCSQFLRLLKRHLLPCLALIP
eukprot:3317048-Pleurochrysis_carterae.AAC.1